MNGDSYSFSAEPVPKAALMLVCADRKPMAIIANREFVPKQAGTVRVSYKIDGSQERTSLWRAIPGNGVQSDDEELINAIAAGTEFSASVANQYSVSFQIKGGDVETKYLRSRCR